MSTSPARSPLRFQSVLRSDVGLVRENNEDSAYARGDCLILADGMGGHSSGEVASAIAVRTFAAVDAPGPETLLAAATRTREVLQHLSHADETLETMGTTIITLCEADGSYYACHIGDSRLYRLREGVLTQITTDHTHVQHLVETGRITREEIRTHPYRAMLLKSLDDQPGGSAPDLIPVDLRDGDRVLLCSDGLSDYVSEAVLRETLLLPDLDEAADGLVAAAFRSATRDNVTVIVADVVSHGGAEPRFAGAAAEGLALSPQAQDALAEADPEGLIPLASDSGPTADPLTQTGLLPAVAAPAEDEPTDRGFGRAGIYAALIVAVLTVVVALLL